jgi:hypothetical protein
VCSDGTKDRRQVRGDRYCIVVRLSSATFTVGGSVSSDIKWVEI